MDWVQRLVTTVAIAASMSACSRGWNPPAEQPHQASVTPSNAIAQRNAARARKIYVATGNEIATYPATANGNVAPTVLIAGGRTQLDGNEVLAVSHAGAIWTCKTFRLLRFAPAAHGNVAPDRQIEHDVPYCRGMAVDRTGRVALDGGARNTLQVWGPGASGKDQPRQTIAGSNTGLNGPWGLAFTYGGALYAASVGTPNSPTPNIAVFAPRADGNATPLRSIAKADLHGPYGICVDPERPLLWVANSDSSTILAFRLSATGSAQAVRSISGPHTGLYHPEAVAVDAAGYVYVYNTRHSVGTDAITVYAPGASGDAVPIQTIAGSNVKLGRSLSVR
jgi:DNA-binding beta-propeller fold protein YncE